MSRRNGLLWLQHTPHDSELKRLGYLLGRKQFPGSFLYEVYANLKLELGDQTGICGSVHILLP